MAIFNTDNTIFVTADFTLRELPLMLAAMHRVVNRLGFRDITLDFKGCTAAYAGPMLGLAAHAQSYWSQGVDVALLLPEDEQLSRLFKNSNWAHLIDLHSHEESRFTGKSQVPAIHFKNGTQQHAAVEKILGILFGALSQFSRSELRALEWSLNEITDNVINHSQSQVGGFVQVTNFSIKSKRIEFAVADPGIGIPNSLRPTFPELRSDNEALDRAIREGVTRDVNIGQGNGLFGTWRITQLSAGRLNILSGYGSLSSAPEAGLHVGNQQIPFSGTLVVANIPYARPIDLSDAFQFGGKKQVPTDYVETHFEVDDRDRPIFRMAQESSGFGSRESGRVARNKILNLQQISENSEVVVDLDGIPLVSSSYADEVFGMLFLKYGPLKFSQFIKLKNVDPLVENLINRSILQRAKQ